MRFTLLLVSIVASGCATIGQQAPQSGVPISDAVAQVSLRFDRASISSANAAELVHACMPEIKLSAAQSITKDWKFGGENTGETTLETTGKNEPYFMHKNGQSYCLKRTVNGHTIFPAEAFELTLAPQGVSSEILASWYLQIARTYSEKGQVTVAYQLPGEKIFVARYQKDTRRDPRNSYSSVTTLSGLLPYNYEETTTAAKPNVDINFSGNGLHSVRPYAYRGSFAKMPFDANP